MAQPVLRVPAQQYVFWDLMQILPLTSAFVSPLAGTQTGLDKSGKAAQAALEESAASRTNPPTHIEFAPNDTDTVSISAGFKTQAPVPVYAEIWKGAVKVAQVDIHGHVISYSGLVASGGGGLAGPLLAAQRAVQLAQQTGGEIRTAGQVLDGQTLLMRARLANTYAV
jgi:hypothetical protein